MSAVNLPNKQLGNGDSSRTRHDCLDCEITDKLTKLTVSKNNSSVTNSRKRKRLQRRVGIFRSHQIFKNIESVLTDARNTESTPKDAQLGKKVIEQRSRKRHFGMDFWKYTSSITPSSQVRKHPPVTVDNLIELFDFGSKDHFTLNYKLRRVLSDGNLTLSDEEWNRFACHVASFGVHETRTYAVGTVVMAVRYKSFRLAFAQEVCAALSNYVLAQDGEKGILELIALLLMANWPREHARSDLESNAVLFYIISSIKGWLKTITGEANEVEEVESSCACALYEICCVAQRKLWIKWPELVDESYAAVRDAITSNITLTKEARKALLDTIIMMHDWTSRSKKTMTHASTQTRV